MCTSLRLCPLPSVATLSFRWSLMNKTDFISPAGNSIRHPKGRETWLFKKNKKNKRFYIRRTPSQESQAVKKTFHGLTLLCINRIIMSLVLERFLKWQLVYLLL